MTAFLIDGFGEVRGGLGAMVKLFWPIALVYLVMMSVGIAVGHSLMSGDFPNMTWFLLYFVVLFVASIYVFLALCQGAVAWHRHILLNEPVAWISPIPRLRSVKYAWAVFLFILIFMIGYLTVTSFTLPYLHSIFTSTVGQIDFANPTAEQLEIWRRAVWPIQALTLSTAVILASVVLWFGRTWLLIYPYISIRSTEPAFGLIRERLNHPASLVGALLIVYFLPSLLGTIFYAVTPISVQLLPAVQWPMMLFNIALSFFCFLWGLSMLSLAYRQAAAGVRLERNDAD